MNFGKVALLSALPLLALGGAAGAETITFSSGGVFGSPPAGTSVESFDSLALNSTLSSYTNGFATFTGTGVILDPSTSVPSNPNSAEPFADTTKYLSIQGGKSETITFGALKPTTFGLYWGSIDLYNSVKLNYVGGTSDTYTGGTVPASSER